ncbi:MAG: sigma-70 family RNA polymerase sigma factor [Ignavibacteria bacterium]|nr:sigma-70 family RNA polymerase sigma factor [Ignavibacteria bacterium]
MTICDILRNLPTTYKIAYACYLISFLILGSAVARFSNLSNRQLVEELKERNRLGCVHLMDRYQDRLLGEARHVFHIPNEDSEEIVSDVLLAVVNKIHGFEFKRSDGDFHLWVMTIFRNRVRDFVRRRALTEGLVENFEESQLENEDSYSSTEKEVVASVVRQYEEDLRQPEGDVLDQSSSSKLQAVVETLDLMEAWERVLLRCRALDVPYEEIAKYTGKSPKQLKVYHARVKKKFVNLLSKRYAELKPALEKVNENL